MVGGERHRREKRGGQEDKGETLLIKRLQRLMTVTWHFNFYYVIAKKKNACGVCVRIHVCLCLCVRAHKRIGNSIFPHQLSAESALYIISP